MDSVISNKRDRINIRLKHKNKLILERAASCEGKTLSNFILDSAITKAKKTITEYEKIFLNMKESVIFFNAFKNPIKFNKKLREALLEHDKLVISK